MRKRLSLCVLIILLTSPLFAASLLFNIIGAGIDVLTTRAFTTVEIDGKKVTIGGNSIGGVKRSLAKYDFSTVEYPDRLALYEAAKLPVAWPSAKNLLLGFGSGSKIQGDMGGKLFGEIADWASLSSVGVGASLYLIELILVAPWAGSGGYKPGEQLGELANGFLIAGAIGFGASRLIQAIMPPIYGARHSKALRQGLGINKDTSDAFSLNIGAVPLVDASGSISLGVQMSARISL